MAPLHDVARAVIYELVQLTPSGFKVTPYGYYPTKWIGVLFLVLFSITTAVHFVQALFVKPRSYWMLPTAVMCGLGEVIGWAARTWSSINSQSHNAFLMQITTTIIAPTFLTAAFYAMLSKIIARLGPQYTRMSPRAYIITFVTADFSALVVQAVGGAQASGATNPQNGSHIMLAGIFLQLVGISIYMALGVEFLIRFHQQKPLRTLPASSIRDETDSLNGLEKPMNGPGVMSNKEYMMVNALIVSTVLVVIRSVYRAIELAGGWNGPIITTEWYFAVFDAAPVVVAMFILNVFNPAFLLRD